MLAPKAQSFCLSLNFLPSPHLRKCHQGQVPRKLFLPGDNPTIVSFNASVVKSYNTLCTYVHKYLSAFKNFLFKMAYIADRHIVEIIRNDTMPTQNYVADLYLCRYVCQVMLAPLGA
jgi:hypothetical protein